MEALLFFLLPACSEAALLTASLLSQVRSGAAAAVLRGRGELLLHGDQQHLVPHSTAVQPAGPHHAAAAAQRWISGSQVQWSSQVQHEKSSKYP